MPDRDRGPARELFDFAVERLPSMRLDDGAFCFQVAAPKLEPQGRSLRYTLIVLLGLLRAEKASLAPSVDAGAVKSLVFSELDADELGAGDLGLVLWADARSGLEAPGEVLERIEAKLADGGVAGLEGLELSWIALGCMHAVAAGCWDRRAERLATQALSEQVRRAQTRSGLFHHWGAGRRARFPNFATQIYGVLALAEAARLRADEAAAKAAVRAADRLLELQRPDGGWPWIFDVRHGTVVEPYEIYSVHQDAMAPMALNTLSEATGESRYREAALRGLKWVWGENDLSTTMLDRKAGFVNRSIRRRRPLDRFLLYANTATAAVRRPLLGGLRGPLELNRTDRPYHLGWLLEAWAGAPG